MAREVDRLLADLADIGHRPLPDREPARRAVARRPFSRPRVSGAASGAVPTRGDLAALWTRVLLGAALGGVMTQWPYPYGCGLPLLAYLGAVAAVMLTGGWIGFASWKLRNGVAHVLSLILFFWGIVLAAEQLLPRIGYAAEQAAWSCRSE